MFDASSACTCCASVTSNFGAYVHCRALMSDCLWRFPWEIVTNFSKQTPGKRWNQTTTEPPLPAFFQDLSSWFQLKFPFFVHKSSISPSSRSRSFYPGGSLGAVPDKQKRARGEKKRGTSASKLVAYHGCYHGCISWIQKWWRIDSDAGKRLQKTNWKDPPFFMGKSTNCRTGHFNSYENTLFIVDLPIKDGH